jgi:hypothetical protein
MWLTKSAAVPFANETEPKNAATVALTRVFGFLFRMMYRGRDERVAAPRFCKIRNLTIVATAFVLR